MNRQLCAYLTSLSVGVLTSLPVAAQMVHDSTVSGRLVSAGATLPTGETSVALMHVPDDRWLILTQVCLEAPYQQTGDLYIPGTLPSVVGAGFGAIPPTYGCTTFHPGIALEPGEVLKCETREPATAGARCVLTGVLTEDGRTRHRVR